MAAFLVGLAMLAGLAPAPSGGIDEVPDFGTNPGDLRMFRYTPEVLPAGRPVVVGLHGCGQDAAEYGADAGWVELADRWGFVLVLPQQQFTNNPARCFTWFDPGDTARGSGEAESVVQMVRASATGGPVFAAGLSAGGAMTAALLAAYPDVFAGGAVVAGVPAGCATTLLGAAACMTAGRDRTPDAWGDVVRAAGPGPWPVVSVWHGTVDLTVNPVNRRELVEQWTDVHGAAPAEADTATGYPHEVYRDGAGRAVVESWRVTGMGHGQPVDPGTGPEQCGTVAPFLPDEDVCAAGYIGRFWGLDG